YDSKIVPRIMELNNEYKMFFQPLNDGMIIRKEFEKCWEAIENGKSLIIHGKAGRGKSGCAENIISHCEKKDIRYLAIKLDKRIPSGTAEKWGSDLGLPASIVHCMHSIAKDERAVIILDQLDALRWTQAHSRDALIVCSQIIEQVKYINIEREYKISLVFISRTYDLENDNNIKIIFRKNDRNNELEWEKIYIDELDDEQVKNVIGEGYLTLTDKLKDLLRIPSNLYIWQHLNQQNEYNECSTTNHLVRKWWNQLSENYSNLGHSENNLTKTKENLVNKFDELGRICIPLAVVSSDISELNYLSSNGFLIIQDKKVSFAHQSILDSLLADNMLSQYYSGQNIINIIGTKEKQTPGRRYQLQMFMQNLIEYESMDFLNVGLLLLDDETIRFSYKFVFFEVLNQVGEVDSNISNFIIEYCENRVWSSHLINNVIFSRVNFYRVLRDAGILDKWFNDSEKKDLVLDILISIRPNYDTKDLEFIKIHALSNGAYVNKFALCFSYDINEDSDEMFELRMQFYCKFPEFADKYIDFKSMLKCCELRTIRYFAFLLENKIKNREQKIHRYEDDFLLDDTEFLIQNGEEVLQLLLPYLPVYPEEINAFSDWSGRYDKVTIERACIRIIKKASAAIISTNPDLIWKLIISKEKLSNILFNEIFLDIFINLPTAYSDRIISFIIDNFENIIFDKTSGNRDELALIKQVIAKHGITCRNEYFSELENLIIHYISPRAKDWYKSRIEYNKEKHGNTVYWSFHGDLQYELLKVMPIYRLSNQARQELQVLERKFPLGSQLYNKYYSITGGLVTSPVSDKKLSDYSWKGILLSKKLKSKKTRSIQTLPGRTIDSSLESFSKSFSNVVAERPEDILKLVLSMEKDAIDDVFIDVLFDGISQSDSLINVDKSLIENAILRYRCNYDSHRASSICRIIEKKRNVSWSQEIIDLLIDIAHNNRNPEHKIPNTTNINDNGTKNFNTLFINAINCICGQVAETIGALLWDNPSYFYHFKKTIEHIIIDESPAVRLSSMFILFPVYNFKKDWASEIIVKLLEEDYRFAGFHGMRNMFFLLYSKYKDNIIKVIEKCYKSDDEDLVRIGSHCLAEMYILKNEFEIEMSNIDAMSQEQANEILKMVMLYFNQDEYNELAKHIINRFRNSKLDLESSISRLFYDNLIDLERDEDFLLQLMESKLSHKLIDTFIYYLERESLSLIAYKNIIFAISQSVIKANSDPKENIRWIGDSISKLIIGLYDEVSNSQLKEHKEISAKCLDIWDLMFEHQIGSARTLSQEIMQR
ncbi:MAG TPA: hypothetical protein GXZ43_01305, partial [Clostridiaceae bacterium]|nr:hypothetical protein [Clostridiaceae bacterium]